MLNKSGPYLKPLLFRMTAAIIPTLIVFLMLEFILRIVPIPGIKMLSREYDSDLGLYKFAPNTKYIGTNIRYEIIERDVNSEGFLDKNHTRKKPVDTYRIGFFGDSFVEALQVPLEKTFFRIIEEELTERRVETLAFGQSSHGPIHSYLKSKKYSEFYDLDMVIYVFYENDLGDQIEEMKKVPWLPYAELYEGDVSINRTLISRKVQKDQIEDNIKSLIFFNHSILVQTIFNRLKLLKQHGIKIFASDSDFNMTHKADINKVPRPGDLPSSWHPKYQEKAKRLGKAVILKWFNEITTSGKSFAILYIPRDQEWLKAETAQDSWRYWLKNLCGSKNIEFIDPVHQFSFAKQAGKEIYDDHFSEDGHVAFAQAFLQWFNAANAGN